MLNIQNVEKDNETFSFIGDFLESELLKTTETYYDIKKDVSEIKDGLVTKVNLTFIALMAFFTFLGTSLFLSGFALVMTNVIVNIVGMSFLSSLFSDKFFESKKLQKIFNFLGRKKIDDYNLFKDNLSLTQKNLKENLEKPETRVFLAKLLTIYSQYPENKNIINGLTKIMRNYMENDLDSVFRNFIYIVDDIKVNLKSNYEIKKYVSEILNEPTLVSKKSAEVKILEIYKKKPKYNK